MAHIQKIRRVLTEDDVKEIMVLLEGGMTQTEIADKYYIAPSTVGSLVHGKIWTHITGGKLPYTKGKGSKRSHILTEKKVKEIIILLRNKEMTQAAIGKQYGVSQASIGNIANGKTWCHITHGSISHNNKGGTAILTNEEVGEVIQFLKDGMTQVEIGDMYNISATTIGAISLGRCHTDCTGGSVLGAIRGKGNRTKRRLGRLPELSYRYVAGVFF